MRYSPEPQHRNCGRATCERSRNLGSTLQASQTAFNGHDADLVIRYDVSPHYDRLSIHVVRDDVLGLIAIQEICIHVHVTRAELNG
jgi:hypothetical protein